MKDDDYRRLNHNVVACSQPADQAGPSKVVDTVTSVTAATAVDVSSPNKASQQASNVQTADAEASGRIVVQRWDAIAENGVFAAAHICAGEVLGVLQGTIVRRRRLSRAERRRLIGIRVDGRAAHLNLECRWPEMINHASPSRCNVEWNADTWEIKAIRNILPGQQLTWDYSPGFWVDALIDRDYSKLPKDQQSLFDMMHAMVNNYTWLIHAFERQPKLSLSMRIGIVMFYLTQLHLGPSSTSRFLGINGASNRSVDAQQDQNPLAQYLTDQGFDKYHRPVDE